MGVASGSARADPGTADPAGADPTKEQCFDANEAAQGLRASGRLREAQDKLALCASRGCPGPVRRDCTERLDEVQRALPTVVFAVRSPRGDDMTAVRVQMDGTPLPATLGGGATPVDPGLRAFRFEADGFAPIELQILVREGEKERGVSVVLQPVGDAPPGLSSPARADAPSRSDARRVVPADVGDHGPSTRRWIAAASVGVGVAGVAVGGVLALAAKSQFDRAEQETGATRHDDSVSAVSRGNVATGVMSAGALLALGGAVIWLTAPSPSLRASVSAGQLSLRGRFW